MHVQFVTFPNSYKYQFNFTAVTNILFCAKDIISFTAIISVMDINYSFSSSTSWIVHLAYSSYLSDQVNFLIQLCIIWLYVLINKLTAVIVKANNSDYGKKNYKTGDMKRYLRFRRRHRRERQQHIASDVNEWHVQDCSEIVPQNLVAEFISQKLCVWGENNTKHQFNTSSMKACYM